MPAKLTSVPEKTCLTCGKVFTRRKANGALFAFAQWARMKSCSIQCHNRRAATDPQQRLWVAANCSDPDACWIYKPHRKTLRYGLLSLPGERKVYAHRAAYEYAFGPIPPYLVVRHQCGVKACINPQHLAVGTQHDNIADMAAHGQTPGRPATLPECPKRIARRAADRRRAAAKAAADRAVLAAGGSPYKADTAWGRRRSALDA